MRAGIQKRPKRARLFSDWPMLSGALVWPRGVLRAEMLASRSWRVADYLRDTGSLCLSRRGPATAHASHTRAADGCGIFWRPLHVVVRTPGAVRSGNNRLAPAPFLVDPVGLPSDSHTHTLRRRDMRCGLPCSPVCSASHHAALRRAANDAMLGRE